MRKVFFIFLVPLLILWGFGSYLHAQASLPDSAGPAAPPPTVSGYVVDANGPVADAHIQVQGTPNSTTTSQNGFFRLMKIDWSNPVVVTASSEGYYVGWATLDPKGTDWKGPSNIQITLKPFSRVDNNEYEWFSFDGVKGSDSCGLCHREYDEWKADAHSQSAKNERFLSIYSGKNVKGESGQRTLYGSEGKALPPDPKKPHYGPGYKLDNPTRDGNCASCHTPVASKIPNRVNCGWSGCHTDITAEHSKGVVDPGVSPLSLTGDAADGISCDFCHKVGDVIIDPKTGLPYPDMPGILSMQLFRPAEGQQIFFGNFSDVTRRVAVAPVISESEFCAPCHYGVFGGVVGDGTVAGGVLIYNSFGEWLESPYSDPETGQTCQDCHMPLLDTTISVYPEQGGIPRDYVPFHDHRMPGASDVDLLQNSVTMTSKIARAGSNLQVQVSIFNDQTGHHIPTDAPMREMILLVEAVDASGKTLALSKGPVLPEWIGDLAEQPGKVFSKLLRDEWTGEMPTAAYWRPVSIVEDTRIAALETDTTNYTFILPPGQTAQVNVRLLFRRGNQELMKQKGWTDPDILMEEETIQVEK